LITKGGKRTTSSGRNLRGGQDCGVAFRQVENRERFLNGTERRRKRLGERVAAAGKFYVAREYGRWCASRNNTGDAHPERRRESQIPSQTIAMEIDPVMPRAQQLIELNRHAWRIESRGCQRAQQIAPAVRWTISFFWQSRARSQGKYRAVRPGEAPKKKEREEEEKKRFYRVDPARTPRTLRVGLVSLLEGKFEWE